MPEISRFYGIIIKMFFKPKEHEPSHIHALYGEHTREGACAGMAKAESARSAGDVGQSEFAQIAATVSGDRHVWRCKHDSQNSERKTT